MMLRKLIRWLTLAAAAFTLAGCVREVTLANAQGRAVVRERGALLGNWTTTATLHADGAVAISDGRDKGPVEGVAALAAGVLTGALAAGVLVP